MSFGTHARRVRDEQLPLARRHTALRCAVERYCPLGFNATWAYLAATARPLPDMRRDPAALLRALDILEVSRSTWLEQVDAFATVRRAGKAAGQRTPHPSQTVHLRRPCWPGETAPARLGLVAAVANRRTWFRRLPYPDGTLYSDALTPHLAKLHSDLDACASTYLERLGHPDEATQETLTATARSVRALLHPGYAPLNGYLIPWLRFADLLTYATRCHLDRSA